MWFALFEIQGKWLINKLRSTTRHTLFCVTKWLLQFRAVFRYSNYSSDLLNLSNFRAAPSGFRVKNHTIVKFRTELQISFGNVFFFNCILPGKHVTCVFCYLVRSTCNLERVWILSLELPTARRHSRTRIGLMKLEEVWSGEVITFSRAKLLLWFWNGFISIRLMALDWVPYIWIPLSTWKGVTMKALVINA